MKKGLAGESLPCISRPIRKGKFTRSAWGGEALMAWPVRPLTQGLPTSPFCVPCSFGEQKLPFLLILLSGPSLHVSGTWAELREAARNLQDSALYLLEPGSADDRRKTYREKGLAVWTFHLLFPQACKALICMSSMGGSNQVRRRKGPWTEADSCGNSQVVSVWSQTMEGKASLPYLLLYHDSHSLGSNNVPIPCPLEESGKRCPQRGCFPKTL